MRFKDNNNTYMKRGLRKGLMLFISGMLISMSAIAGSGETPLATKAGSASKTIREHVKFSASVMDKTQEGKVNVVFTVDENGYVNLVVVNTANQILRKTIEDQFLTLNLKQLKANNAYSIQFNFKTR